MIYTDIKQAIGNRLLDVKEYGLLPDYLYIATIFEAGILIEEVRGYYEGDVKEVITQEVNNMPEELKELINKYK